MISTVWAVVREGKVVPLEKIEAPEGTRALITLLPDETEEFWLRASESALDSIWDNVEDDCYAKLLEK